MPKFRKKPVVIEAIKYDVEGKLIPGVLFDRLGQAYIKTLEGEMNVSVGDWIITGIKGEKYPCKPDIFEETYEAVDE